ncbi:uncharacterized protein LOC143449136 isoform X2 [Clavelina lepadiformis]|uniref:uncharacterized protein LOC143449136 isoform X2 n=1 Tax=Clavelina lepadiformis TaxID=159417 RepID=UPI004042CC58
MTPKNGRNRRKHATTMGDLLSMSTHEPSFRQGHVGDFSTKSKEDLLELLERQEKLLANRGFLSKLPDQGEKISSFANTLRERIAHLNSVESHIKDVDITEQEFMTSSHAKDTAVEIVDDVKAMQSENESAKLESHPTQEPSIENKLAVVEKSFTNLAIHEGPHYDVVKRAAAKQKRSKFSLHRQQEKDLLKESKSSTASGEMFPATTKAKSSSHNSNELSAATMKDVKHPAMLISIEECRQLHTTQQAFIKQQQARLTAERMMAKYGMGECSGLSGIEDFHPEGIAMQDDDNDDPEGNNEEIQHVGPTLDGFSGDLNGVD